MNCMEPNSSACMREKKIIIKHVAIRNVHMKYNLCMYAAILLCVYLYLHIANNEIMFLPPNFWESAFPVPQLEGNGSYYIHSSTNRTHAHAVIL